MKGKPRLGGASPLACCSREQQREKLGRCWTRWAWAKERPLLISGFRLLVSYVHAAVPEVNKVHCLITCHMYLTNQVQEHARLFSPAGLRQARSERARARPATETSFVCQRVYVRRGGPRVSGRPCVCACASCWQAKAWVQQTCRGCVREYTWCT